VKSISTKNARWPPPGIHRARIERSARAGEPPLRPSAGQRHVTLRLDLINVHLRCVMCHIHELFAKRPAQRIAPTVRGVLARSRRSRATSSSRGDEPLMSPHFETIIRDLARAIQKCGSVFARTACLLSDKLAEAIIAANTYM